MGGEKTDNFLRNVVRVLCINVPIPYSFRGMGFRLTALRADLDRRTQPRPSKAASRFAVRKAAVR